MRGDMSTLNEDPENLQNKINAMHETLEEIFGMPLSKWLERNSQAHKVYPDE